MKEVGGGDQSLVPVGMGETTPLPLPAGAPFRYSPLHQRPPFTPYMANGAFCIDLNSNNQQQHHYSNPLLEDLTISPPLRSFTSLLTGFDDQDAMPPIVREHKAQIDQLIRNQVIISLINHHTVVRPFFALSCIQFVHWACNTKNLRTRNFLASIACTLLL